ncbi:hypothetical protein V8C35DRAFT_317898 [Trichoderma chlorosporum]
MGSAGSADLVSLLNPVKEARKLACRLCQKRKKKCNRKSPCSLCIKLKVPCQPSAPAAPRKRRQSTKDLVSRLAWCEEQLRRNIEFRQCLECTSSTEKSTAEIAKRLSEIKSDPNITASRATKP